MEVTIAHPEKNAPEVGQVEEVDYRPRGFDYVEVTMKDVAKWSPLDGVLHLEFKDGRNSIQVDNNRAWIVESRD